MLTTVVLAPLVGALVLAAARFDTPWAAPARRALAAISTTIALVAASMLWLRYQPRGVEWQFAQTIVGVDGLGLALVVLTAIVIWLAVLASFVIRESIDDQYAWLLLLQSALTGVFVALDFVVMLVCWIAAVVALLMLVGIRSDGPRRAAARRAALFTGAGTLAMLCGIVALHVYVHSVTGARMFDLRTYQQLALVFPWSLQIATFVLFAIAFAATAGLFPFHAWARDVQLESPAAVSAVVTAVVVKLGTFGLMRMCLPMLPAASRFAAPAMLVLASLSIVYGAAAASWHREWKRVAAHASLCLVGLIVLSTFQLTPAALTRATALQVDHGLAIAACFVLGAMVRLAELPRVVPFAGVIALTWLMSLPLQASLFSRIETTIARVVLRVSPEHAAEVKDCLANAQAPPPPPSDPGLPAGMSVAAPCTEQK